jgi:hypothetical protein
LDLAVLAVMALQFLPHHKTVQILFLAPLPQRAVEVVVVQETMEEREVLVAAAVRRARALEAAVQEIPHPQVHHKVTMAAMELLPRVAHLEPVVAVVVHLPWVLMHLQQPLAMVAPELRHL